MTKNYSIQIASDKGRTTAYDLCSGKISVKPSNPYAVAGYVPPSMREEAEAWERAFQETRKRYKK